MMPGVVPGSRPLGQSAAHGVHLCARCGVARQARKGSALCRDCLDVLEPVEIRAWAA